LWKNLNKLVVEDEDEGEQYQEGYDESDYKGEDQGEEGYYYENGQEVEEPEYINPEEYSEDVHGEGETPKEGEEGDNVDYYESDPINYQRISHTHGRKSQEAEREDIRAIDMKAKSLMQRSNNEYEEEEEQEYQEEEGYSQQSQQYEVDEDIQVMDEGGDREEEEGEEEEIDQRHGLRHMQDVEEVVEEEHEEGYGESEQSEDRGQNYYPQQVYMQERGKTKGKAKAKGTGKKKKTSKMGETHGKRKIEQRELLPPTAGMKKDKHNKSMPGKVSAKKSKGSISAKSKKLVHSKSERNLNMAEEEERVSESVNYEEHSEDQGMEPIDHQAKEQESEMGSQQEHYEGHIDEEDEEGIQEDQERRELEEDLEQIPDGNIYKILSENVMRVKENLRENREIQDIGFDDEKVLIKIIDI